MFTKENIFKSLQTINVRIVLVAFAVCLAIPLVIRDAFMIHVLTLIAIFTLYASSWNLLASSGQGSLGHAAFLGIGGFVSSLLAINLGVPPIIGIFLGGAFSAGIGFLIGITCVRLKAWFLAMVTFGFSIIAETLVSQFDDVTHGILGFRTPLLVPSGLPFYYFAVLIGGLSVVVIYVIMKCFVASQTPCP